MKLSAPKKITWWIAVIVGGLGILGKFIALSFITTYSFWLVAAAFVLLVLATYFKDL